MNHAIISCRDGLSDPPHAPKKRLSTGGAKGANQENELDRSSAPDSAPHSQPSLAIRSKSKQKKAPIRPDKTLEHLEALHEGANVQKSIRITDGHRLKLDNPQLSSSSLSRERPRPSPPEFNLTFADMGEDPSTSHGDLDDDEDVDFPDIDELLKPTQSLMNGKQATASESSYSNPEMDALIRDIPLDNFDTVQDKLTESPNTLHLSHDQESGQSGHRPFTPGKSIKRSREMEKESPTKLQDYHIDHAKKAHVPVQRKVSSRLNVSVLPLMNWSRRDALKDLFSCPIHPTKISGTVESSRFDLRHPTTAMVNSRTARRTLLF